MYECNDITDRKALYYIEQIRRKLEDVCNEALHIADLQGLEAYPCVLNALSQQLAFTVLDAEIPVKMAGKLFKSHIKDIQKQEQEQHGGQIIPFPIKNQAQQFSDQELLQEAERRFTD